MELFLNDIFLSFQGETSRTGFPSLFIRLAGCNLNCSYCDTPEAKIKKKKVHVKELLSKIKSYQPFDHLTITGGEPLQQKNIYLLFTALLKEKNKIQLETNGSFSLEKVPKEIIKIVDIKTPSSTEESSFLFENLNYLSHNDEIKFVLVDNKDYLFAKKFIKKFLANYKGVINFSPVRGKFDPKILAQKILKDNLLVRLNLQLHKIIEIK